MGILTTIRKTLSLILYIILISLISFSCLADNTSKYKIIPLDHPSFPEGVICVYESQTSAGDTKIEMLCFADPLQENQVGYFKYEVCDGNTISNHSIQVETKVDRLTKVDNRSRKNVKLWKDCLTR